MISPFGRPLEEERVIRLGGGRPGAAAHDYYLFGNGEVWCLESSSSMYSPDWWVPVRGDDLGRVLAGGRTVAQRVAEVRGDSAARPEDRGPGG